MPKSIPTPIPEICDRYTIALLKRERLGNQMEPGLLAEFNQQIEYYHAGIDWGDPMLVQLVEQLFELNSLQWSTEGAFRAGLLDDQDMAVLGQLAIRVREINCSRTRVKNQIQQHTGSGFTDIKMNYGTEPDPQTKPDTDSTAHPTTAP